MKDIYQELHEKREKLQIHNNPDRVEKMHKKGKLTAEERMLGFFDKGTYLELKPWTKNRCNDFGMSDKDLGNEGILCGCGEVNGKEVFAMAHDVTVMGGSMGEAGRDKVMNCFDKAMDAGKPLISFSDAAGARIQEGVGALHAYCSTFGRTSVASGWIPQITVISGTCAGGTAYCAAITDFIIQVDPIGKMFITGPGVIKSVTGEETTFDEIGGSQVHSRVTGLSHFIAHSEEEAFAIIRSLLSFIPPNSKEMPPKYAINDPVDRKTPEIRDIIPLNQQRAYDVKDIIRSFVDNGDFLEVQKDYAMNMVIGFARMAGETVGIVANQPKVFAGVIDVDASWKSARFVRFCDSYNIPLIILADTPGYMPGVKQEHGGIIRNGAKLLFAFAEATVPKITVVLRKDFGGAYSAMCGKGMGTDFVLALPTGELAIMGADGAAAVVFKKELAAAEDKDAKMAELTEKYKEIYLNPYRGAEYGIVDDVIDPSEMREALIKRLKIVRDKPHRAPYRKHTNGPL